MFSRSSQPRRTTLNVETLEDRTVLSTAFPPLHVSLPVPPGSHGPQGAHGTPSVHHGNLVIHSFSWGIGRTGAV
jgi:hypothetical protein